jgi:hypothetical protein
MAVVSVSLAVGVVNTGSSDVFGDVDEVAEETSGVVEAVTVGTGVDDAVLGVNGAVVVEEGVVGVVDEIPAVAVVVVVVVGHVTVRGPTVTLATLVLHSRCSAHVCDACVLLNITSGLYPLCDCTVAVCPYTARFSSSALL